LDFDRSSERGGVVGDLLDAFLVERTRPRTAQG
jgi:hypothetical protein